MKPAIQHCDECVYLEPKYEWALDGYPCVMKHKPRFYKPKGIGDSDWGYKRRCADFKNRELKK